jgi:hypothetical protein
MADIVNFPPVDIPAEGPGIRVLGVDDDDDEPVLVPQQPKKRVYHRKPATAAKKRQCATIPVQVPETKVPEVKTDTSQESMFSLMKTMSEQLTATNKRMEQLSSAVAVINQRPPPLIMPTSFNWKTTERSAKQCRAVLEAISGKYLSF